MLTQKYRDRLLSAAYRFKYQNDGSREFLDACDTIMEEIDEQQQAYAKRPEDTPLCVCGHSRTCQRHLRTGSACTCALALGETL